MPSRKAPTDLQAIKALDRQWGADATAGHLDRVVGLYAKDGSLVWPDQPVVQGLAGIRSNWRAMLKTPGLKLRFVSREIRVAASGDLATDFGEVILGATGQPTMKAKYLVAWTKVSGTWKVLYDSWNTNQPPAPPAPAGTSKTAGRKSKA